MNSTTNFKPTVLIADDEPLVVSALARSFRRAGFSFISDTTSEHVFELAKTHRPDIIVLDIHQNIDGRDLLAKLKADPATKDLKVIMLSAVDDQYTRVLCLQLGAEDYDVKPFDVSFVNKVARLAGMQVH